MQPHGVYEAERIGYLGRKFVEFRDGSVVAVTGSKTNLLGKYYYSNGSWYFKTPETLDGEYHTKIVPSMQFLRIYDSNGVEDVDSVLKRRWFLHSP